MGSAGTPQGSVISPMLFNLIMIGLPARLNSIYGIHHSVYADDITIWACEGSDGEIEQRLQEAVATIEEYLDGTGLECSPDKSELLLYRPTLKGRPPKGYSRDRAYEEIQIHTKNGRTIPIVEQIRVLGLIIESKGTNGETVKRLVTKVTNAIRLIKRVTNKHQGMKEANVIRLIYSFAISHIIYVAAYLNWYTAEKAKINALIRKAYKQALCLPDSTSTERLLQLGLHNTLEELIEAQQIAQLERLASTRTGRSILDKLGITYHSQQGGKVSVPKVIREKIQVPNLPKNMHPELNQGRRESRAKTLLKAYGRDKEALFVDAAEYPSHKSYVAAVINSERKCISACSIRSHNSEIAEEVAIAQAIIFPKCRYVISDSQSAIRNYARGRISPEAANILLRKAKLISSEEFDERYIIWFPAHTSCESPVPNLNEEAHRVARGLTYRARDGASHEATGEEAWRERDRMFRFCDIIQFYQKSRRIFPPPSSKLDRSQEVDWRRLQTRTFPNPVHLNRIYPELYPDDSCKQCGMKQATLEHILWQCAQLQDQNAVSSERLGARWKAALISSDRQDQLWAIQRAREAAERQGLSTAPGAA
uniref:Putative tick transposon n=1 Tax=Rhipicephalus pulchellus TaxID=72859 RepID=L7M065_RHIPC